MPKRKHTKKIKVAPRTDANQGIKEHNERVRKQNDYIIRKLAEYRAKQEAELARRQAELQGSTSMTVDGLQKDDETSSKTV